MSRSPKQGRPRFRSRCGHNEGRAYIDTPGCGTTCWRSRRYHPPAPMRPRNDFNSPADATVERYYSRDRGRFSRPVTRLQRLDGALVVRLGRARVEFDEIEFPVKGGTADP